MTWRQSIIKIKWCEIYFDAILVRCWLPMRLSAFRFAEQSQEAPGYDVRYLILSNFISLLKILETARGFPFKFQQFHFRKITKLNNFRFLTEVRHTFDHLEAVRRHQANVSFAKCCRICGRRIGKAVQMYTMPQCSTRSSPIQLWS